MKKFFWILLLPLFSSAQQIIPAPVSMQILGGTFPITPKTSIIARDAEDKKTALLFNEYLQQVYGFKLAINNSAKKNYINFTTLRFIKAPEHEEGYSLNAAKDAVTINGNSYSGTFYGMQTLIQLLPTNNYKPKTTNHKLSIPLTSIQDYPRFSYRGMHLDVSRHFFPVSFVKKYIDYLALHKLNFFHWHLTDDQGWRIEIKKYPALTKIGAWRNGTIIGRYPGTGNDNRRYGGFYTQEQIKEIVKYAMDRRITVIPEIEMPGHSSAAIAAYPWLSCFPNEATVIPSYPSQISVKEQANGRKKLVQETFGVFEDVFCAGSDSTFSFLQSVLDEILPLFPSQYIHVGGDECPKSNWKRCPKCQQRIKDLHLKDEHELQSYFVRRVEKYLNSKGRTLIGWDEILEGGLAPNAWVMSWRGEKGGVDAASQDHNVIMTPERPLYFDESQSKNEDSLIRGGYNPLEDVYAYEPVPNSLNSEKSKFILGAQANVWTEYFAHPTTIEYMVFPRMSALSEVLWSPKEKRNWSDFEKRLQTQFKRYELWKANYSKAYFDLTATILPTEDYNGLYWVIKSRNKGDLSVGRWAHEKEAFTIIQKNDTLIKAKIFHSHNYHAEQNGKGFISFLDQTFSFNKVTGKKVSITTPPNSKYPGQGGAFSLVNGIYSNKGLSHPDWLGWVGDDMEATIDLGRTTSFDSVRIHTLDQNGSWVYLPQYVEVLISDDGNNFTSVGKGSTFVKDTLTMGWITVPTPKQSSRFIKVVAKNYGTIPDGKPGAGNKAWLFADEIQVY